MATKKGKADSTPVEHPEQASIDLILKNAKALREAGVTVVTLRSGVSFHMMPSFDGPPVGASVPVAMDSSETSS